MDSIKAPYMSPQAIIQKAESAFLEFYGEIPALIELLLEKHGFEIIPVKGLKEIFREFGGHEAFLSIYNQDILEIYIDEDTYLSESKRGNFTLAHELGHYVLHQGVFSKIENYDQFCLLYSDHHFSPEWETMEWQADTFASYFLMPKTHFASFLWDLLQSLGVTKEILDRLEEKDRIGQYIDSYIAKKFEVSKHAAQLRVRNYFRYEHGKSSS